MTQGAAQGETPAWPAIEAGPGGRAIHRQTYVDLVHWHLGRFGTKAELASRLGVDAGYLSGVLAPPLAKGRKRMLPPALARRMAELLCPDPSQRDLLLFHMARARRSPSHAGASTREASSGQGYDGLDAQASALFSLFEQQLYWSDAGDARLAIVRVLEEGQALASRLDPVRHAHPLARVLIGLGETSLVIGEPDRALHHARTASLVLAGAQPPSGARIGAAQWRRDCDWYALRIARLEAPAHLALCRPRAATEATSRAMGHTLFRENDWYWVPRLHLNLVRAISRTPRFSLYWAERLHEDGVDEASSWGDTHSCILLDAALVTAYLSHGSARSARRAESFLRLALEQLSRTPHASRLHRLQVHLAAARFFHRAGALQECEAHLDAYLRLARETRLPVDEEVVSAFRDSYPHVFRGSPEERPELTSAAAL